MCLRISQTMTDDIKFRVNKTLTCYKVYVFSEIKDQTHCVKSLESPIYHYLPGGKIHKAGKYKCILLHEAGIFTSPPPDFMGKPWPVEENTQSGFHVFLTKENAEYYANEYCDQKMVVVEVICNTDDLIAAGYRRGIQ